MDVVIDRLEQATGWDVARQRYQDLRIDRTRRVQIVSLAAADAYHLPDGPAAEVQNAWLQAPEFWNRSSPTRRTRAPGR